MLTNGNHVTLVQELERDEGLRLRPYRDTRGILTIGIGRNLDQVGITREEAYILLAHDLESVEAGLDRYIPWWRKLDPVRQRVLANMTFNMGISKLLEFSKTLRLVNDGQFADAADEMLHSSWAVQVGPRAFRLADMMRRGT